MRFAWRNQWIGLLVLLLSACSPGDTANPVSETQRFYFLESLNLVESAGRQLQGSSLDRESIQQALSTMDAGLKLAFRVDTRFLNGFNDDLGKNYQRLFVQGIETYRTGVEAGDEEQLQSGLRRLGNWSKFWSSVSPVVIAQLQPQ